MGTGTSMLSELLERFVYLIPKLITAGIIMLIGEGVARLIPSCGRAVLVAAWAIAWMELDLAVAIATGAFLIVLGALALRFALPFG